MCYGHEWGWTSSGNWWSQTFIWNNWRENLHCLRPHSAKMLLAKRILDDVRQKWRSKEASGRRTLCFHLACEQGLIWASEASRVRKCEAAAKPRGAEGPFSPPPLALASPLACHSCVYFSRYPPNGELVRRLVFTLWWNSWTIRVI